MSQSKLTQKEILTDGSDGSIAVLISQWHDYTPTFYKADGNTVLSPVTTSFCRVRKINKDVDVKIAFGGTPDPLGPQIFMSLPYAPKTITGNDIIIGHCGYLYNGSTAAGGYLGVRDPSAGKIGVFFFTFGWSGAAFGAGSAVNTGFSYESAT